MLVGRGEYWYNQILNCLSANMVLSETAWRAQPENLKPVYHRHSVCSKTKNLKILKLSYYK